MEEPGAIRANHIKPATRCAVSRRIIYSENHSIRRPRLSGVNSTHIQETRNMAAKKQQPGNFVRIQLKDNSWGYARLLEFPQIAFYNLRTTEPSSDLDQIAASPVAFTIAVHKSALDKWEIIGK